MKDLLLAKLKTDSKFTTCLLLIRSRAEEQFLLPEAAGSFVITALYSSPLFSYCSQSVWERFLSTTRCITSYFVVLAEFIWDRENLLLWQWAKGITRARQVLLIPRRPPTDLPSTSIFRQRCPWTYPNVMTSLQACNHTGHSGHSFSAKIWLGIHLEMEQ